MRPHLIIIAISSLILAPISSAETPLTELIHSPEMHRFEKSGKRNAAAKKGVWFEKGSNFAAVFADRKGPRKLLEWSAPGSNAYSPGAEKIDSSPEFVRADKTYSHKAFGAATLTILIPHPKFTSWVENRLIKEFSDLEPPSLVVSNTEKINFSEFSGTLYSHRPDNTALSPSSPASCSFLIKLSRSTFVNLASYNCKEPTVLIRLAEALDLKRLERKINS